MKKKLSFLLALVFIFTLAFSVLPGAAATVDRDYGSLTVTKSAAPDSAVIAPEQEFIVYVYFESNNDDISVDTASSTGIATKLSTPVNFPDDGLYGNYQWKLDLNIGESVKFINVNERDYDDNYFKVYEPSPGANWNVTYSKDNGDGHVNDTENESITVTNKLIPPYGTVTITKDVVTNHAPATGVQFPVSVRFTLPAEADPELYLGILKNGSSEDALDGYYLFQLADGASITFSNLPVGTTYVVDEILTDTLEEDAGWALDNVVYRQDSKETSMKVDYAGDNDTVTVNNKYLKGMLQITKFVTGNAPAGEKFPVTVTFENYTGIVAPTGSATDEPGVYKLDLVKDETVVFYGIPTGTTYTVSEDLTTAQQTSGWVLDRYVAEGVVEGDATGEIVNAGAFDTVEIYNKYTKGMLTVTKDVPDNAPKTVPFPVTVTFLGSNITSITNSAGIAPSATTSNLTYTFDLLGDTSITFYGIPVGTVYTYSEDLSNANYASAGWYFDGYDDDDYGEGDKSDNGKDKIKCAGEFDTVKLINKYCAPGSGTIEVKKIVTGVVDELNPAFTINVTFSNTNPFISLSGIQLNNTPVTFNAGTTTVSLTLKSNETATLSKIPVGTTYVVSEATPLPEGYLSAPAIDYDDKGDGENNPPQNIDDNKDLDKITVTNNFTMPTGKLTVDKTVPEGDPTNVPFTFTVVFSGKGLGDITFPADKVTEVFDVDSSGPAYIKTNENEPASRTFTFTLTAAELAVLFENIPLGTTYTVTETKELPQYWTYVSGDVTEDLFTRANRIKTALFENDYDAPPPPVTIEYGTLTVDKTVSGTNASGTEPFAITVTFTANPWNVLGITNNTGLTGNNGVYTFTLTANAPVVTFSNIPAGTTYTVSEAIATTQIGWTEGASTGKTGSITTAGATAVVANVYAVGVAGASDNTGNAAGSEQGVAGASDVLPQTGGIASSTLLGLLGLALIAIGGTAFTLLRKKNTGKSK